jgi:hypothetical protein
LRLEEVDNQMTPEQKVEHWLDIAEYDLETAAAARQKAQDF